MHVCVCVCVYVTMCVCLLDGEGGRVFASTSLVIIVLIQSCI